MPLRDTTCGRATFHLKSEEVYKDIAHTRNTEYTWSYVVVSDLNWIFEPMKEHIIDILGTGTPSKGMINLELSPEYLGTSIWVVPDFLMK